jgi:hypothetical protein
MEELDAYRQGLLSALEGVVNELSETIAGIPSSKWHWPFGLDSHTPHYTLAHLCVLETQVFMIQLHRILDEETPLLPVFDVEVWMESHYKPEESVLNIMQAFSTMRKQELNWLLDLPPASWSRVARHPSWGVHTLQWWVELQLDYSYQHLRELSHLPDA